MLKNSKKLSPKQGRFVLEYLVDLNGTQAAIRAGYSMKTADVQASQLLGKLKVQRAVEEAARKKCESLDITVHGVLGELSRLAYSNMLDYMRLQGDGTAVLDWSNLTRDQAAAIQEVTIDEYTEGSGESARPVKRIKFKLADKGINLERLGRYLKLFSDKVEHSSVDHINITVNYENAREKLMGKLVAEDHGNIVRGPETGIVYELPRKALH